MDPYTKGLDGSWDHKDLGGVGFIIKDTNGLLLIFGCRQLVRRNNIYCEAWAIKEGIQAALRAGIQRLLIETYSLTIVNLISNKIDPPRGVLNIIKDTFFLCTQFLEWKITNIYQEGNRPAN